MRLISSLLLFIYILLVRVDCYSQTSNIDSLLTELKHAQVDSIKVKLFGNVAEHYLQINPKQSINIGQEAIHFIDSVKYQGKVSSKLFRYLGYAYLIDNDTLNSKHYLNKSLEIALKYKDTSAIAYSHIFLGTYYNDTFNFYKSIKNYKASLKFNRSQDNKGGVLSALQNISTIYMRLENYQSALEINEEIINICMTFTKFKDILANSYSNKGFIYYKLEKYNYAIDYFIKSKRLNEELSNHLNLALDHLNLARVYVELGEIDLAIKHCNTSRLMSEKLSFNGYKTEIDLTLSKAYYNTNIDMALDYAMSSYRNAESSSNIYLMWLSAEQLHKVYASKNLFNQAYKYLNLKTNFEKVISDVKLKNQYVNERINFEIKEVEYKKNIQLAQLEHDKKNEELLLNNKLSNKNKIWLAIVIVLLMSYSLVLIKQKQELKKSLKEKSTIENRIEKIERSIASDLHDNFGNRLMGVLSAYDVIKDINKNSALITDLTFKKFANNIEKGLLPLVLDLKDLMWAINPVNNDLFAVIERLGTMVGNYDNSIDVNINYPKTKNCLKLPKLANRQILLIIKELINNAIKYSKSQTIDINLFVDEVNHIKIECIDYGVGFDMKELKRINGINNIYDRAQSIDFVIEYESNLNEGTKVTLKSIYPMEPANDVQLVA